MKYFYNSSTKELTEQKRELNAQMSAIDESMDKLNNLKTIVKQTYSSADSRWFSLRGKNEILKLIDADLRMLDKRWNSVNHDLAHITR